MSRPELKLAEVFAVLKPDLMVDTVRVTPTIYEELDSRFDQFKNHVLVSEHEFSMSWPAWERHPAGDEIVVLLSGRVEMVMRKDGNDECVSLTEPGSFVVVPAGTWHTARTSVATRMLFVTPGEGTEHRTEV
jgi:mannose-6-phosphate isomerase-like protein (cupin superfamily)